MEETLKLNQVYEGPEGRVWLSVWDGVLWMTADYQLDLTERENLLRTVEVALDLFDGLKAKGVQRVYCLAGNQKAFNFNEHLGFETVNVVFDDKYEVMVKEL